MQNSGFVVEDAAGECLYWSEDVIDALHWMNTYESHCTRRCADGEMIATSVPFWMPWSDVQHSGVSLPFRVASRW